MCYFNIAKLLFIECFILNGSIEGQVDVYLHHGGRWIMDLVLSYVGGDVHSKTLENLKFSKIKKIIIIINC